MRNLLRFFVVATAVAAALVLANKLDKFLGLLGALLCAPLALFFPAALHWKVLAKTNFERGVDFLIIVISLGILIFCVGITINTWNSE